MALQRDIAKHFNDVFFGGNWTSVNLKETLKDVNWQQATTQVYSLNTIAKLVFHINYYVEVVLKVLKGGALNAHDKYSFDLPPIHSEDDWYKLLNKTFSEAEEFASLVEKLPPDKIDQVFTEEKYGTYHRNLHGIIEHTHYHLGQIVIIKKIVMSLQSDD